MWVLVFGETEREKGAGNGSGGGKEQTNTALDGEEGRMRDEGSGGDKSSRYSHATKAATNWTHVHVGVKGG